jgi:sulfate adenylyltransferase subunit 2
LHRFHRVAGADAGEIIVELRKTTVPERAGRAQDQADAYAMEKLRREGYM